MTQNAQSWIKKLRAKWVLFWGGNFIKRSGRRNKTILHDALLHHCRIEITGSRNTLEIMPGVRAWNVRFRLVGDGLYCRVGANSRLHGGSLIVEDRESRLQIGSCTTLYSSTIVAQEGGAINIGDDCLIAYGTDMRNSDAHSILDSTTRERLNPSRDIQVQNHVWIGMQCQILKGVTITQGSIVAARSVVTKDIPANTLVAGVPARIIRENVEWDARRL